MRTIFLPGVAAAAPERSNCPSTISPPVLEPLPSAGSNEITPRSTGFPANVTVPRTRTLTSPQPTLVNRRPITRRTANQSQDRNGAAGMSHLSEGARLVRSRRRLHHYAEYTA